MPEVAADVIPEDTVGTEVDAARADRVAHIEGRGPVVTNGAGIAKVRAEPAVCGRKEDTLAVGTRDESSVYSVLRCPCPSAVVY